MLKTLYDQDFQHMTHGDSGIRTHDLLNAIQALSQLSYAPKTIKIIIENSLTCQYNCKI